MLFLARMDVRSRAGMDAQARADMVDAAQTRAGVVVAAQTRAGVAVEARLASAAAEDFFGSAHG